MCLEFHPNFVCFLIVEAGEKSFVAFGQKGLRDLVIPPLNFFLCLGFVIIYHQIQVSHQKLLMDSIFTCTIPSSFMFFWISL